MTKTKGDKRSLDTELPPSKKIIVEQSANSKDAVVAKESVEAVPAKDKVATTKNIVDLENKKPESSVEKASPVETKKNIADLENKKISEQSGKPKLEATKDGLQTGIKETQIRGIKQSNLGVFSNEEHQTSFANVGGGIKNDSNTFGSKYASGFSTFSTASPTKSSFSSLLKSSATASALKFKTKEEEQEEQEDDENVIESVTNVALQPKVPPPPPASQITGEEDENTLESVRCKLFSFEDETWKERGSGYLKLNKSTTGDQYRLIMRADVVYRVILNIRYTKDTPKTLRNDKYLEMLCCEKAGELTKILFRFRNNQEAEAFYQKLVEIQ